MSKQTRKSVDDLVSLSRVEFLQNIEETISDELKEYQEAMDAQAKIDIVEEDNSMQYAYNKELPYIF
jgi:hypothetical protein